MIGWVIFGMVLLGIGYLITRPEFKAIFRANVQKELKEQYDKRQAKKNNTNK